VEEGNLYQQPAKGALLGMTQVGGKQLRTGVAVFGLLDAVLPGNDGQELPKQKPISTRRSRFDECVGDSVSTENAERLTDEKR